MTTVVITGGAGFIGSHIADLFVNMGWRVRVFDNFRTGKRENLAHQNGALDILEGDVRDCGAVERAIADADYVVHQAAAVSVVESVERPRETFDINVTGTLNVLEAARGAGARKVVIASSCAVYGDGPVPAREAQELRPLSPYAASKMAAEALARSYSRSFRLPTVCLRYFNVFGPRQDPSSPYSGVIALFADRLGRGERAAIYGDGGQTRDFIYVEDVARANALACERPADGIALNVGTGRGISVRDLHSDIARLLGQTPEPVYAPAREGEIYHSRCDPAKITKCLNFRAETAFREGLRRTLDWYRAQR